MPSVPISESNEQRHTHSSLRGLVYASKETTFHTEAAELD